MRPLWPPPGSPCPPGALPIPGAAPALLHNTWPRSPGAVPPLAPLLSMSLIGNISLQGPSTGDCPGLARQKQGRAMLGCEPEAPLKLPPSLGPAGTSPLCPGAVAPSKVAHQSPSCLSSPLPLARHKERIWLGSGREDGKARPGSPWGCGTCQPWLCQGNGHLPTPSTPFHLPELSPSI